MTKKQRKAVRRALREPGSREAGWNGVLEKARAYYANTDPVYWELLRLRYMEGMREDAVIKALYIGRTTYYTKELEVLSTVGIYAAQAGLLREE